MARAKNTKEQAAAAARRKANAVTKSQRKASAETADIGPLPDVVDPARKESCRLDLFLFLTTYFPHSTGLHPFSEDHKRVIARMQRCILHGGRFVNAVYRGFAKTTISENACIWAILYGHSSFVLFVGINKTASTSNIESIKREIADNELLSEDFPEVCHPVEKLENKPQRCASQTFGGENTHIIWRADTIVLPTIPGSKASGAIVISRPYPKARGVKHKRSDGVNARPDLAIIDDPQDDESAASSSQVRKNLNILRKSILQSAGHGSKLAAIVNATVIAKDDMVERLLNDPAWQGERIAMVQSWATSHDTFWLKQYATVRRTYDPKTVGDQERAHKEADQLYRDNRNEADAGCVVSWIHAYDHEQEVSAIQHAYNVFIDDGPEVFASEYQNEPLEERQSNSKLTAELISNKTNGLARGVIPKFGEIVTAYIDVHLRLLYYVVAAWSKDFTGSVVDYGTYPRQPLSYFAQQSAPASMADACPGATEDAWIAAGLTALTNHILGATFMREDAAEMHVGQLLIDARWGEKNTLVKQFCRRHPQAGTRLMAAQGQGIGPAQKDFSEYRPEQGTRTGFGWRIAPPTNGDRWVTVDTNSMKSHVASRLALPMYTPGGIELFGTTQAEHSLFADHCVSEAPVEMTAKRGIGQMRTKDVWEWLMPHNDNHYWDCLVGSAVAASMLGCQIPGTERQEKRKRLTAADIAAIQRRNG